MFHPHTTKFIKGNLSVSELLKLASTSLFRHQPNEVETLKERIVSCQKNITRFELMSSSERIQWGYEIKQERIKFQKNRLGEVRAHRAKLASALGELYAWSPSSDFLPLKCETIRFLKADLDSLPTDASILGEIEVLEATQDVHIYAQHLHGLYEDKADNLRLLEEALVRQAKYSTYLESLEKELPESQVKVSESVIKNCTASAERYGVSLGKLQEVLSRCDGQLSEMTTHPRASLWFEGLVGEAAENFKAEMTRKIERGEIVVMKFKDSSEENTPVPHVQV